MMEYIFFDTSLRDIFVKHAQSLGVACDLRDDPMGWVVAIPEDLADDLAESLETHYDELQAEQSDLMSRSEGGLRSLAGFQLALPDGKICMVPVQPEVANRLLSCFTLDEIQSLFDTVARSALSADNQPLCKTLKADTERH